MSRIDLFLLRHIRVSVIYLLWKKINFFCRVALYVWLSIFSGANHYCRFSGATHFCSYIIFWFSRPFTDPLFVYVFYRTVAWHTVLSVDFKLSRHLGYFLINVYIPCCLLVILSWVAFWINREATADRIALGMYIRCTSLIGNT